jgi:antirestriction protein ArdC
MESKTNAYEAITDKIIGILEAGKAAGSITWNGQGEAGRMPYNLKTGDPYSGVNVLSLWIGAESQGYTSPAWLTFKQAIDLGGHVRKGEKSVLGIYFEARERKETNSSGEEETRRVPFVKTFHVFNLDQVEGIPKPEPFAIWNPLERAEEVMRNSGASIIEGGTRAFYNPMKDDIRLPDRERFRSPENFYAVALHELTHWTGHKSRLARDLKNRFGTEAYAMEELVAELGAAFLSAETGVKGKLEHHASYVESWLRVLKGDKKAIVTAASAASKASRFILDGNKVPSGTDAAAA